VISLQGFSGDNSDGIGLMRLAMEQPSVRGRNYGGAVFATAKRHQR
jgi:hypothetical protein